MNEFDNIKKLWTGQKQQALPDAAFIIQQAENMKRSYGLRIILQVLVLLASVGMPVWISYTIPFKEVTTYIGLMLVCCVIISFCILRLYQLYRLTQINVIGSPRRSLGQLQAFYKLQRFMSTTCIIIYMLLLNIALFLYFIEVTRNMATIWKIVTYTATFTWTLVAYFVFGKKQARKEYARTETIIKSIRDNEAYFQAQNE